MLLYLILSYVVEILCRDKRVLRFSAWLVWVTHFLFGVGFMSAVFADNLKRIRIKKGYTQADLAKLLNIDRTTLTKYETGVTEPDFERLRLLCRILEIDYNTILQS